MQNELKSINLSATNGTFFTKGEIERNFLTTLTDEQKFNHWVKTILNQIVIQFEPSEGVFKKLLSISPFFSIFLKSDSNLLFLIKYHLEEIGKVIIKKVNKIFIGKTPVKRNSIYYFYQNLFLLVVLTCWKRNTFEISMEFHLKKRKIIFETLFSTPFDVLHSSPIVYLDHTELIF